MMKKRPLENRTVAKLPSRLPSALGCVAPGRLRRAHTRRHIGAMLLGLDPALRALRPHVRKVLGA